MRIGIDARLWNETGVGRYIRNLIENLSEIDNVNEYVLFMRAKDARDFKIKSSKFKVVPVDIRWHTLEEQIRFPQILNNENLDLMHFPYFSIPIFYKKPYVVTIHDLIINHFPTGKASTLPLSLYLLKRLGYKYIVSRSVNRAKKIIVPTNAVKEDLARALDVNKEKIVVTHEGIDSNILVKNAKDAAPDVKYFLYVGNAYPHKNLERLIKAFSSFRHSIDKDVKLFLVGKDDYFYRKLQEKIEKENYSGIIIRNNVKDSELSNFYQNATALISPSLMEGFGLPVLEAMASGCVVIASDIPSLSEVCEDAAVYFDPNSIEDMKDKLLSVFGFEKSEIENHKKKGLNRSKHFSWGKMSRETLEIYESCTGLR